MRRRSGASSRPCSDCARRCRRLRLYNDPHFRLNPQPNITREAFEAAVRKTVEYIHAGDCIQVVLSQRFSQPITAPPFYLYRALRTINRRRICSTCSSTTRR
jgi:anthranilate/para-aminobenzoate synthase component I